jgi:glycosyltransferase involved in cell wall biosynthesis
MKILFVLPRMVAGGVERVTLNLARELRNQGIECRLALRSAQGEWLTEAKEIFTAVDVMAAEGMRHFVPNLAKLIKSWKPTHLITAFADIGLLTLLARRQSGLRPRLIHGIHNTHTFANRRTGLRGLLRFGLDGVIARLLYPRVDALVCVSKGIEAEVKACCPSVSHRTHTIYNPIANAAEITRIQAESRLLTKPKPQSEIFRIVGLGRLTHQKGFDVLIDAARKLPASPPWHIDIYGDGSLRGDLQRQVERHELQHRICLRGYTNHPYAVLQDADLFVLSSRHEGFGLVVAESMLLGVQIVATDCPHGPREILDQGRLGQLVPVGNATALTQAVQRAMSHDFWIEPAELQHKAATFSSESSAAQWIALLGDIGV